jgi:MYXO-CTERM domain-containing protein
MPPVCPDAITSASAPVVFHRSGPVDFGPGTGMMSVGDHSTLGLDYNLLFSGMYDTQMAGHLHMTWPPSLSITATGDPNGGYLDVTFGLHMTATLWVAGIAIPLPLDVIIDDHTGHGRSMFTPWAWNYEGTDVHLNVSAWRDLYTTTVSVGSSNINVALQMRYNVDASIKTVEIGFPDHSSPTAMQHNLAVITETMPVAVYPPPRDGNLDLLTRWKASLRYQGSFEFRINTSCADPPWVDPVCAAATGILGAVLRPISTPPLISSIDTLPDPFDQAPHFDLPIEHIAQTEIDFGDVHIGDSVMLPLTADNPGRSTLALDPQPAQSPFTVGMGACVPAGGTVQIPTTFQPPSVGTFQSRILVNSNGTIGAPTVVVLTGNGVTGPTRPAASHDGGVSGDGSAGEYRGAQIDASCACRTAGAPLRGRAWIGALAALAAIGAFGARRRR